LDFCLSVSSRFRDASFPLILSLCPGQQRRNHKHVAVIKVSGTFNSGKFYADLQNDEVFHNDECKGRWKAATPPLPLVANDMASVWDTVYGDGYYTTHILGAKTCARGSGACKKQGTVLDAEICLIEDKQNRKGTKVGVAKDSKNSIYKMFFFF